MEMPERTPLEDIDAMYKVPEEHEVDEKWFGVPPKGEQPLPGRFIYVLMILGIISLEICIWAVYRWSTAEFFESFGTHQFYLLHIIAAPTIHLIPIILFWIIIRKERGLPFVFTKKLLLSGIIVGFVAAIIWRVIEELLYNGFAGMAGGTVPDTFTFLNILETADLFILMTFVMYFIVGPVEELEFRSFTHDQASRVLPNWLALIFSSVLFGCSHIPIAIFVYQFSPTQFIDALIGWIAAGFTFGALYMWSRNIFGCIVMHSMGNWQLSVFYLASASAGMSPGTAMWVGIATSIVSNAIMIFIFYLIHKYYWQPHRRGEPAFGGRFLSIQSFIYDHDFERKPLQSTIMVFVLFIVIVSGIIMGTTVAMGRLNFPNVEMENDSEEPIDLEALVEVEEVDTGSGSLQEGQSTVISNFTSAEARYLKAVTVTVTWTDEDDIRRVRTYQNQPDTFSVAIIGPNVTAEAQGANPQGGEGSITAELILNEEQIAQLISEVGDNYGMFIELTLVQAGNFQPGVGVIGFTDNANDYNFEITTIWLEPE